jgi:CSLREA domain-containing protein/MYXO-CTERM domain-containing protein
MRARHCPLLALLLVLATLPQFVAPTPPVHAATFTVNSALDEARNPAAPAGVCQSTPSGGCTLRAAIQTANALAGADVITLPGGPPYALTLGTLSITSDVTINGGGAASTIIDGGGTAGVFALVTANTLNISGLTIQNGAAAQQGGGIFATAQSTLNVSNSIFTNNRATAGGASGGGIHVAGTLNLTNSTIRGNVASNAAGGLRIFPGATATVTGSTFSGNQTTGVGAAGGGIHAQGPVTLTNSTISGNSVPGGGTGGGLAVDGTTATLLNVTLASNTATAGSSANLDVFGSGATVSAKNTIIANPTAGLNCRIAGGGMLTSGGSNLDSSNTCGFNPALGDLINTDPQLGALANNGGPTPTQALLVGSSAINAVTASNCPPPSVDQRGVTRPQGSACDIGAFEFQPASVIPGDINQDGIVDIRDYGLWRQHFGQTNCGNPADLDGNCIVDILDYGLWRANFGHTAGAAPRGTPGSALLVGDQRVESSSPAVPIVPLVGGLLGLGGLAGWRRRRPPGRE